MEAVIAGSTKQPQRQPSDVISAVSDRRSVAVYMLHVYVYGKFYRNQVPKKNAQFVLTITVEAHTCPSFRLGRVFTKGARPCCVSPIDGSDEGGGDDDGSQKAGIGRR